MRHLYLIRHGQSQANADHKIAGSHDSPLSDVGRKQAEYAGQTLKRYYSFDLIVSSTMSRARETAQIIAREMGYPEERIEYIEELRERNLGDVEGRDYSEAPHHNGNYEDAENVPGVEPIEDLKTRVGGVLKRLQARPEQSVLIVAHNGCGRMMKVVLAGQPAMAMYEQPRTENAVIYKLN